MGQRISTPAQLRQAIGQGLPPLTWVSGDELLLVIEAADLVRAGPASWASRSARCWTSTRASIAAGSLRPPSPRRSLPASG
ncbi:hypothetical protein V8H18_07945 [Lautropia mirabilis]